MSSDPDLGRSLTVTDGPVTVTKSFEGEEFPVPAVKFVLESTATEPTSIRLTDTIPESFPMESVGFHPDFEKDNWTAYKSHRVEYERTLDPGESTTTVYGVRLDGTDPATFLVEPSLSFPDADAEEDASAIDDVLGEDSNQIVRDVLSGERESLPGVGDEHDGVESPELAAEAGFGNAGTDGPATDSEPEPELELDLDPDPAPAADEPSAEESDPSPSALDASAEPAVGRPDTAAVSAVGDAADTSDASDAPDASDEDDEGDEDAVAGGVELDLAEADADGTDEQGEAPADGGGEADEADDTLTAAPGQPDGSVVAALAAEVRRGDADEDDVAALRDALDTAGGGTEIPRSLDLRIGRLQTQLEDLAAYSEGLREFLDEEGTAEELIEEFRADVRSAEQSFESLSARVDDADDDRARLDEELSGLHGDVSDVNDRVAAVEERFGAVEDRLDTVTERFDAVDDRLEDVDDRLEELDGVADRLEEVDDRAAAAEATAERLDDEMGDVREDLAAFDTDLAETREELADDLAETREQVAADVAEAREELDDDVSAVREDVSAVHDDVSTVRDDVADLENDIDDLGDTVENFRAFRDRLSSALGTMGAGPDTGGADTDGESAADGDADHDADGDDADDHHDEG
jgi:predicted  nucleic acid-binding Zn-ribbon protein